MAKAKDTNFWIGLALAAQQQVIKVRLLHVEQHGMAKIGPWDDLGFALSWFTGRSFEPDCRHHGMNLTHVRRGMDKLARNDFVDHHQAHACGVLQYRFPRQVCDLLALDAIEELLGEGYCDSEARPVLTSA